MTEWLHFLFSLSCIGEGNGNPLQCCCPKNPRDGGAWWAAVYGIAQSRTRLKQLSSCSSSTGLYKTVPHPPGPASSHPCPHALHPHIHAAEGSSLPPLFSQSFGFTQVFWPWGMKWQHAPVFLPGKFHGLRGLVGYSPWGRKELDTAERLRCYTKLPLVLLCLHLPSTPSSNEQEGYNPCSFSASKWLGEIISGNKN